MARDNDFDLDDDDTDNESSGSNDTPQKLRALLKKQGKEKADLEKQVADLLKRDRERGVKDVLIEKGANPKLAKFVLADLDEVTDESVAKWLEDYAELFGVKQENDPAAGVSQQDAAAYARIAGTTQSAITPDRASNIEQQIANAGSEAELEAVLRKAGLM